jgi:hypothetical protein
MKNNELIKVVQTLQTKFGWSELNQLTPIQKELISDVIKSIDIRKILEGFEIYYQEEYGENIVSGAIDEYLKYISNDN